MGPAFSQRSSGLPNWRRIATRLSSRSMALRRPNCNIHPLFAELIPNYSRANDLVCLARDCGVSIVLPLYRCFALRHIGHRMTLLGIANAVVVTIGIPTIVGLFVFIGQKLQILDSLESTINSEVKPDIKDVRDRLATLEGKFSGAFARTSSVVAPSRRRA